MKYGRTDERAAYIYYVCMWSVLYSVHTYACMYVFGVLQQTRQDGTGRPGGFARGAAVPGATQTFCALSPQGSLSFLS